MRTTIRETEEKLLHLQTYSKSYIEKILENHDLFAGSFTKFSGDTQVRLSQLESGVSKFDRYTLELNEKLYQTASKLETEQLTKILK